ncbi:MAG: hypothetical protein WAV54_00775 [Acidimicrobiales bacterium]
MTRALARSAVDEIAGDLATAVDQFGRYGDIDQARAVLDAPIEVLERLWAKVDALAKHRKIDPELRADILRVAGRIDPDLVGQLKRELDEAVPAAVLEAHAHELIEDRATLGAFPRRDTLDAPTVEEWLREDPRRLRGVVFEMARFCGNDRRVAEGVLSLAETLGIDGHLAADITGYALRDARQPQAVAQ